MVIGEMWIFVSIPVTLLSALEEFFVASSKFILQHQKFILSVCYKIQVIKEKQFKLKGDSVS